MVLFCIGFLISLVGMAAIMHLALDAQERFWVNRLTEERQLVLDELRRIKDEIFRR